MSKDVIVVWVDIKLCSWAFMIMVTVPKKSGVTESKMHDVKEEDEKNLWKPLLGTGKKMPRKELQSWDY